MQKTYSSDYPDQRPFYWFALDAIPHARSSASPLADQNPMPLIR